MRNFVNDIVVKSGLTDPKSEDFLNTDTKEESRKQVCRKLFFQSRQSSKNNLR